MTRHGGNFTFQFVVFRVRMEQHIREQLFKGVACISRSVLHICPHRLVQLHQKLLRWRPQLLYHLVPLVNILGLLSGKGLGWDCAGHFTLAVCQFDGYFHIVACNEYVEIN